MNYADARSGGFLQIERTKRSYECRSSQDCSLFPPDPYFRRVVLIPLSGVRYD